MVAGWKADRYGCTPPAAGNAGSELETVDVATGQEKALNADATLSAGRVTWMPGEPDLIVSRVTGQAEIELAAITVHSDRRWHGDAHHQRLERLFATQRNV